MDRNERIALIEYWLGILGAQATAKQLQYVAAPGSHSPAQLLLKDLERATEHVRALIDEMGGHVEVKITVEPCGDGSDA